VTVGRLAQTTAGFQHLPSEIRINLLTMILTFVFIKVMEPAYFEARAAPLQERNS